MPIKLAKKLRNKKTNMNGPVQVYKGLKNSSWGKKEWLRLTAFLLVCGAVGYITFNTFAVTTIAHPDGSLFQLGTPTVYLVQGGQKRGFTSEDAFNSNHFNWGMITAGNAADALLPDGPTIGLRGGTLIMTPGNLTVWVVVDNGNGNYTKWGIPSPAIFDALGYSYSQVLTVPASELPPDSPNLITGANHPGGQFVVSGGIVYMIAGNGKYRVADPSVLNTYNFPLYTAVPGDDALPTLGFLPFHQGSLVEGTTDKTVYMIGCSNTSGVQDVCAMQRHGFTDENTFYTMGYNFNEVLTTPQANLDGITKGTTVSVQPDLPPPGPSCLPQSSVCDPQPQPPPPITNPSPPPTCLPSNPLCTPTSNLKNPSGSIDSPTAGARVFGGVTISGWALDNTSTIETSISNISVSVDGHTAVGYLLQGLNRSDVCKTYPGRQGCPGVGWQFGWNSTTVANGTHEIEVTITDSDPNIHHSTTLTRLVTTDNALPPSGEITVPVTGSHVTGPIIIRGWAMDNTVKPEHAITAVKISVNGQLVGNATYGQQTPTTDTICQNYPSRPGCPYIGWSFALDTSQYQSGSTLNVKASITDGDTPPSTATIGATYVVGTGQVQTCPAGQTGTPPNCVTPPSTSGSGATQTIQVIYAYPTDVTPDQVELKNIPLGISQIQTFLRNSTAGVIPSKPKGIALNLSSVIQRVPLPRSTLRYEQDAGISSNHSVYIGDKIDNEVTADLGAKLSTANGKKYLIYVDGAFQDANCGYGGDSWAKFYLRAVQWGDPSIHEASVPCEDRGSNLYVGGPMPASYFQNLAPLHEVFHSLGLVAKCAPGYDTDEKDHDSMHLSAVHDLMHWVLNPPPIYVDQTHNNYYGSNLPATCQGLLGPAAAPYLNTL